MAPYQRCSALHRRQLGLLLALQQNCTLGVVHSDVPDCRACAASTALCLGCRMIVQHAVCVMGVGLVEISRFGPPKPLLFWPPRSFAGAQQLQPALGFGWENPPEPAMEIGCENLPEPKRLTALAWAQPQNCS